MSSLRLRDCSSAVISSACAWWPIIPCMNRTSAAVCWTRDRSAAAAAPMTRLDSPGAPGWTMGGREAGGEVRHAESAAAAATIDTEAIRWRQTFNTYQG